MEDVAAAVPYRNLTAALVLDGVDVDRVTDFGTSYTTPEDFLDHLVGFGLFTTDGAGGRPVDLGELDEIVAPVRRAQSAHYRAIAAMIARREDPLRRLRVLLVPAAVRGGGRPDRRGLDRAADIPEPLYQMVSAMEGDNGARRTTARTTPPSCDLRPGGADELRHAEAAAEEWTFSFWTADGSAGGLVSFACRRRRGGGTGPPSCRPASRCST